MMKRYNPLPLLPLLLLCAPAFAQRPQVTGVVADSAGKPLPASTVVLIQAEDSVLYKFTITDNAGVFLLKDVAAGDYVLQISYMGYRSLDRKLSVEEGKPQVDLDRLTLTENRYTLGGAMVEGQRIPILFKEDTIEYNAESFKPKANDAVEELLKKLPGVEVSEDGTVKAQGQEVKKVLVDGKEFFGDDPKLATKNLPADAIDKVQVYDKLSDIAEFTGVDDGEREKTINLMLKEGRKHGYFGNYTAGYGSDNRYEGRLNANTFTKKTQLSAIGMANNTNQQGFSTTDYINFMGGLRSLMRGGGGMFHRSDIPGGGQTGNGLINTAAGGLNFNNKFGKHTDLNLSYFYNGIANDLRRTVSRQSFSDERPYTTDEDETDDSRNANHRVSYRLKHELDTLSDIQLRGSVKINDGRREGVSDATTYGSEGTLTNTSSTDNSSNGTGLDLSNEITWRKKMLKPGRTFVAEAEYGKKDNRSTGVLYSNSSYYLGDSLNYWFRDTLRQNQNSVSDQLSYGGKLVYTEPLKNKTFLQFTGSHRRKTDESAKRFFDVSENPSYEEVLNPKMSSEYNSNYFYNQSGLDFMVNSSNWNVTAGAKGQYSFLEGEMVDNGSRVSKEFRNILPAVQFNYRYSMSKRLRLRYETRLNEPSVDQLQPVTDNSDPLKIYVGNPNLDAEYTHSLSVNYMSYSQFSFTSFFAYLMTTYTTDKITNSVTVDTFFRQITRPVNVDDNFLVTGYASFSTPVKYIKTKVNLSANLLYNRGIQFVNTTENDVDRFVNTFEASLENSKKGTLDVKGGARFTQTLTAYSVSSDFDQDFLTTRYFINFDVDFLKTWRFNTDFAYTVYSGGGFSSDQQVPLLQAYIAKKFLKNDKGQLKLAVFDILDRNSGINRTSDLNYVEEETIQTIGRYVMLSFSYSFRTIGGKAGKKDKEG